MARHNIVFLYGFVSMVQVHQTPNGQSYAMAYVTVARGDRPVGDNKQHAKLDSPLVMSRNPRIIEEMSSWKQNDIVEIKGTMAAKAIKKASYCAKCRAKNSQDGAMVYINPIFAKRRKHMEDQDACIKELFENREVSNEAYVLGNVCRDPKKMTPKEGLVVTQYQIAINRKFRIREDAPEIKADYPWVKSYGENAVSDRDHLQVGSEVYIDGCIQARKVRRRTVCTACNTAYEWVDKAMELVPFETEYLTNFKTEEEITEKKQAERDAAMRTAFAQFKGAFGKIDEITEEDRLAGLDDQPE